MGIIFKNSLPKITGDVRLEVATPTYSGKKSTDLNDSINPYTSAGPGDAGAGLTETEINIARGGSGGDPDFANVTLLLHGEGTDGGTTFIDSSSLNNTLGVVGAVRTSATQAKFGLTSIESPSAASYLEITDQTISQFGTGDFTVEFFVYLDSAAAQKIVNFAGSTFTDGWMIQNSGGTDLFSWWGGTIISSGAVLTQNTWEHLAFTRSGSTIRVFVNGTSVSEVTNSNAMNGNTGYETTIGWSNFNPTQPFLGFLDEVRITKGVARYTSNFTVPTEAYPDQ